MSTIAARIAPYIIPPLSAGYELAKILGTRGYNGMPQGFTVLDSFAKIIKGKCGSHPFLQSIVLINNAIKPSIMLVCSLSAPMTELPYLMSSIKEAGLALRGLNQSRRQVEVTFLGGEHNATVTSTIHEVKGDPFCMVEKICRATTKFAAYGQLLAKATKTLSSLGAITLSDETIKKLTHIIAIYRPTMNVFSALGAFGGLFVASLQIFNTHNLAVQELPAKQAALKCAIAGVVKMLMQLASTIFATYLTLATQGVLSLAILALHIYIIRTEPDMIAKEVVHLPTGYVSIPAHEEGITITVMPKNVTTTVTT